MLLLLDFPRFPNNEKKWTFGILNISLRLYFNSLKSQYVMEEPIYD